MSMKVLIADLDWRFAQRTTTYLESRAHLVVSQTEPQQLIDQAARWQPDLIILAAELAETDLLEKIYDISPRPAVLLTEHMNRYDRAWRVWQKGGDELLMKPIFNAAELRFAIAAAMESATVGTRQRPTSATA